jgi:hypothetical protein
MLLQECDAFPLVQAILASLHPLLLMLMPLVFDFFLMHFWRKEFILEELIFFRYVLLAV